MRFLSMVAAVMLGACAVAQPLVVEDTCSGFIIGKSTKADVLNKCGQPKTYSDTPPYGSGLTFITSGHFHAFTFDAQGILTTVSAG
jgi:hypothetical protein